MSVEVGVERVLAGARRVVGDHGLGSHLDDRLADMVGVVSGISDDDLGRCAIEEDAGLRSIARLACSEDEAHRAAEPSDGEMDFGAQAAARTSDGLILSPPFAPLACW